MGRSAGLDHDIEFLSLAGPSVAEKIGPIWWMVASLVGSVRNGSHPPGYIFGELCALT